MTQGFPDGFQVGAPLSDADRIKILGEFKRLQERAKDRGEVDEDGVPIAPNQDEAVVSEDQGKFLT